MWHDQADRLTWPRPAPPPPLGANQLHLWLIDLRQPAALHCLSAVEEQRARGFRHPAARTRYRRLRCATRSLLGNYAGQAAQALEFASLPEGKPVLRQHPELHFNLSHTGRTALLGVTGIGPLGVDLEFIRPLTGARIQRLAERVFSGTVTAQLADCRAAELPAAFTREWTRMEARQKATGAGVFGERAPPGALFEHTLALSDSGFASIAIMACTTPPEIARFSF